MKTFAYVEIVNLENQQIEKRIDVSGRSSSYTAKVERGVLINLNREKFYVTTAFYSTEQPTQ